MSAADLKQNSHGALALFALNLLIWGYNWVPMRLLLQDGGPLTCAAIRILGGALSLFAALLFMGKPLAPPLDRSFIWSGLTQVAASSALSSFALIYGGVSKSAILVFTMPFWVMIISRLIFHEKFSVAHWVSLIIALGGIALIASKAIDNSTQIVGALSAIGAGLTWAIGAMIVRRSKRQDTLRSVAWEQLVGAVPLLVFAFLMNEGLPAMTPQFVLAAFYSTAIGTGFGWILWNRSAIFVSPGTLALGSLTIPIIASLSAFLQLGERPDAVTLTGLGIVFFALLVASLGGMRLRQLIAVLFRMGKKSATRN